MVKTPATKKTKPLTMLQENFHLLNSRYFRGRLKNVTVKWKNGGWKDGRRIATTWSQLGDVPKGTRKFTIEIDSALKKYHAFTISTLIHEAVHVEQWDKVSTKACRGRLFNKRMKQLAVKGAFNGLW